MQYLRNAWYMAGWSKELDGGAFVHRTIVETPVMVYRLQSGAVAAIMDRCPHRLVPLHMGTQVGDLIQCGYHGLCFDKTGACVKNPVDGARIPSGAKVRAFPAVERFGGLWLWMGDPDLADESKLPDFGFLVDPARSTVHGYMPTKANAQLAIDNLTDLSHVQFVHAAFQASEVFSQIKMDVKQDGDTVTTFLTFPDGKPPVFYSNAVPDPEAHIDLIYEVRWDAPASAKLMVRGFKPGMRENMLFEVQSAHIVTPETDTTCHYFFGNSRDYAVGDPDADERVREWQRIGFHQQDKPMLENQQRMVGDADIMTLGPVLLGTDIGAMKVRRTLKALMEAEVASVGDK